MPDMSEKEIEERASRKARLAQVLSRGIVLSRLETPVEKLKEDKKNFVEGNNLKKQEVKHKSNLENLKVLSEDLEQLKDKWLKELVLGKQDNY